MSAPPLTALLLLVMPSVSSHANEWQVQPLSCITPQSAPSCEIKLSITFPSNLPGQHCLYLDQQQLRCWPQLPMSDTLTFSYTQTTDLLLKDKLDNVVLRTKLSLKTLSKKRKRIRAPWSFF